MTPQLCQRCSHYLATNHVTMVVQGTIFEYHICEACECVETEKGLRRCPQCGLSLKEIKALGRFGCALDYDLFAGEISGLLEGYHGAGKHVGKIPSEMIFSA